MCEGTDAGGGAELCNMWSPIHNASEYAEELQRCIREALEKCRVQYTGLYSDNLPVQYCSDSIVLKAWKPPMHGLHGLMLLRAHFGRGRYMIHPMVVSFGLEQNCTACAACSHQQQQ